MLKPCMWWDLNCSFLRWFLWGCNKELSKATINCATKGWCLLLVSLVAGSWDYLVPFLWVLLWAPFLVLIPTGGCFLSCPQLLSPVPQTGLWLYLVKILPGLKTFMFQWCSSLVCSFLGSGFWETGTIYKWEKPHCSKISEEGVGSVVENCGAAHSLWLLTQTRNPELRLGLNYRLLDCFNSISLIHLFMLFIHLMSQETQ